MSLTIAKPMLVICALLLLFTLGIPNQGSSAQVATQLTPTVQASDDPTVEIEMEGVVAYVDATTIILDDGTQITVSGIPIPPEVVVGVNVRILARFEGDDLLLIEIVVITQPTPTPTLQYTLTPTAIPSATATPIVTATTTPEVTAEPTTTALCPEAVNGHPVGERLAATFGVSYDEIMSWKCAGFGFGEIARAYALAAESGIPVADIFAMKTAGMGWGNIVKEIRSRSGSADASSVIRINAKGKKGDQGADAEGKGKTKDKDKKNNGNGNGKNNGNGKK